MQGLLFSGYTVLPDSKATKLGSSEQKQKYRGKVPCRTWKCATTAISGVVYISEVPGCHLLRQMSFHLGVTKITLRIGV